MSEANPANESRIVPVYFPDDILTEIETAEGVLKPLGHTRNFIISQATKVGLPKILKMLKDKPASGTFTDLVEQICRTLPEQDITTQLITDKLLELQPDLKGSSSLGNVSKFLERLSERNILRPGKLQGRKKVWHLILPKKASRRVPAVA